MAADGRVNLLLVGSDSRSNAGADEEGIRTDSIVLLSIDVSTARVALFNFPRNLLNAPVTGIARPGAFVDDKFPMFLGFLWLTAAEQPENFYGADEVSGPDCRSDFRCERGWRAVTGTVQEMAGVGLDGLIAVNLNGFVRFVESLPSRGVWLDVRERLTDDSYHNSQRELMPIDIAPGCQLLDAEHTLAYARSRRQDSDYERTRRQQYVLTQIRRQTDPIGLLPSLPDLLAALDENVYTTLADSDVEPLADLVGRADMEHSYQYTFAPNFIERLGGMAGVAEKVGGIFNDPEAWEPSATAKPLPGERCPPA